MDVTADDVAKIPRSNLRVPRDGFGAFWSAAERYSDEHPTDWYSAGVIETCRWLATATVRPKNGPRRPARAPVTHRSARAYEELIEAEFLAAEKLDMRRPRPNWLQNRPGWSEAIAATLRWAWRGSGPPPLDVEHAAAG